MSWLSDLKAEAETLKQVQAVAQTRSEAPGPDSVQEELKRLQQFLTELAEQFEVLNPNVSTTYDVLGYTRLVALKHRNFYVDSVVEEGLIQKVVLRYECTGENPVQFWVENRDECNTLKDRLLEFGLRIKFKDDAHWRYIFSIQPVVRVEFVFEPHPSEHAVRMVARNFEELGTKSYSFPTTKVSEDLLNEFGKKLVGQDNEFEALSGYRVNDDIRRQFQAKIAARQREREAELDPSQGHKTAGRLSRLFKKDTKAAQSDGSHAPPAPPSVASKSSTPQSSSKKYAWMVTGVGTTGESTAELVSRLGPGMEYHAGIKNLINKGTHFRMLDAKGAVQFTGYIVGECSGREPLVEYGSERGCHTIELELDGRWVPR